MKRLIYAACILVLAGGCTSREAAQEQSQAPKVDLITQGTQFLAKGDSGQAIASFKRAIAENPKDTKAYFVLGQTYMSLADYNSALENFKKVGELEPDNGEAYLLMGGCYDLLGNKTEAIASVQQSVSIFQKERDEVNFKRALSILWALSGVKPPTQ